MNEKGGSPKYPASPISPAHPAAQTPTTSRRAAERSRRTADGRTVEFQNGVGSNAPPKVGDEVTVYYDPERPEVAKLSLRSTFRPNLKLLPVVFGIFVAMVALMFLSVFALVVWVSLS